jgi:hypothetical protein
MCQPSNGPAQFGFRRAIERTWQRTGQHTLRITIEQLQTTTRLTLQGRVAGPWAAELSRVWAERASRLASGPLSIDVSNMTYADADGLRVLREIYSPNSAELIATTPWTRHLAAQIAAQPKDRSDEEQEKCTQ